MKSRQISLPFGPIRNNHLFSNHWLEHWLSMEPDCDEHRQMDELLLGRLTDGAEIICLDTKITKKFVDKVLSEKPERFTCLDAAFKNNDQLKTNTALQMPALECCYRGESSKIDFKVI